jgi:site-specific recombinase XerD
VAGAAWSNSEDLCFTTAIGSPIDPANLRRTFGRLVAEAGIEKHIRPYDLRHRDGDCQGPVAV